MISKSVNLTTGPVFITPEVRKALAEPSVSHRSPVFKQLFRKTTELLCSHFSVKDVFLLTGSGTLANEVMLQEIKYAGSKGLILSNGEFGSRLITQAKRTGIDFIACELEWGTNFDMPAIERTLQFNSIQWILFCHCETSSGVINNLDSLAALAHRYNCLCFVDCMSTVGTRPLDLSKITMATASSGKGLASVPGLAIVFSNIETVAKVETPIYLDLHHYAKSGGIPFTIPSNLVKALNVSICQKLVADQFQLTSDYCNKISRVLRDGEFTPFHTFDARVFTIATPNGIYRRFLDSLKERKLLISHESEYLQRRNWCQMAMFGYYTEAELQHVATTLGSTCAMFSALRSKI